MPRSSQSSARSAVQMAAAVSGPNASPATMVSATLRVPSTLPSWVTTMGVRSTVSTGPLPLSTGVVVSPSGRPTPVAWPHARAAATLAAGASGA